MLKQLDTTTGDLGRAGRNVALNLLIIFPVVYAWLTFWLFVRGSLPDGHLGDVLYPTVLYSGGMLLPTAAYLVVLVLIARSRGGWGLRLTALALSPLTVIALLIAAAQGDHPDVVRSILEALSLPVLYASVIRLPASSRESGT